MNDCETFDAGDVVLQRGATLRNCKLAYKTYGRLNADKTNVIVNPTWYSGCHDDNARMFGEGRALDPAKYFIIVPNLLGNGVSSSPSNTSPPYDRARFPLITLYDNITLQHRLVTERFGIEKIRLVTGYSMGAMQAFQWACLYPEMVKAVCPYCGSARVSRHNRVFIEGARAALMADDVWNHGWYEKQPVKGIRAMARVYAGWGFSQAFYREKLDLKLGYSSLEDFLVAFWEGFFLVHDANNLLAMFATWQAGDIAANPVFNGSFEKALGAIKARAIVMPGKTDLYFPPEDSEYETVRMPNAELRPFPSIWGHFAGFPGLNPPDTKFLEDALRELLED